MLKEILLMHHSHADFGYTDHPAVCHEIQKEYVGQAVNAALENYDPERKEQFRWTAESLETVREYLESADETEKERLFRAIDLGLFEVCALPFNQTPFMCAEEWDEALNWIDKDLFQRLKIRTAMQTDVNGLPRAALLRAVKLGVKNVWMGPNTYLGAHPFPPNMLFRWAMPDGSKLSTFLSNNYNAGSFVFNDDWRRGPIPASADNRYRPHDGLDLFRTDRKNMLAAEEHCRKYMKDGFANGLSVLPLSITGLWHYDNDPPNAQLIRFVRTWNDMGLEPRLDMTTPALAIERLQKELKSVPEYAGEWTDWWAIGSACTPLENAASRHAKRLLRRLEKYPEEKPFLRSSWRELCWYDEHIWGWWGAVSFPKAPEMISQYISLNDHAFRTEALAAWHLAKHERFQCVPDKQGVYVTNTAAAPLDGWIDLEKECVRRKNIKAVRNTKTGEVLPVQALPGNRVFLFAPAKKKNCSVENISFNAEDRAPGRNLRFYSGIIQPGETVRFEFTAARPEKTPESVPELFDEHAGELTTFHIAKASPRGYFHQCFSKPPEECAEESKTLFVKKCAKLLPPEKSGENETTQELTHPFLVAGRRTLAKFATHERLTVHLNRKSSPGAETWFADISLKGIPADAVPYVSNGGELFRPGVDQLPGSCKDFYTIDGPVAYVLKDKVIVLNCRDTPLVSFGEPVKCRKQQTLPGPAGRVFAIVFDNTWDTNFNTGSGFVMDFVYDAFVFPAGTNPAEAMRMAEDMSEGLSVKVFHREEE